MCLTVRSRLFLSEPDEAFWLIDPLALRRAGWRTACRAAVSPMATVPAVLVVILPPLMVTKPVPKPLYVPAPILLIFPELRVKPPVYVLLVDSAVPAVEATL